MDTIIQEASIEHDVWYHKLEATIHCESMHYDARVLSGRRLGAQGEVGAVQLHPRGLLPTFYREGNDNPLDFRQAVFFLAKKVALGMRSARAWSCYPR